MTDESKKPIILHVEDSTPHVHLFEQLMRKISQLRGKSPDAVCAHIDNHIYNGKVAIKFIQENIKDIAAVYTDDKLGGAKFGAQIMLAVKQAAETAGVDTPIRFWTSRDAPTDDDMQKGQFTADNILQKGTISHLVREDSDGLNEELSAGHNKALNGLSATIDAVSGVEKSKSAVDMARRTEKKQPGEREKGPSGGGIAGGGL